MEILNNIDNKKIKIIDKSHYKGIKQKAVELGYRAMMHSSRHHDYAYFSCGFMTTGNITRNFENNNNEEIYFYNNDFQSEPEYIMNRVIYNTDEIKSLFESCKNIGVAVGRNHDANYGALLFGIGKEHHYPVNGSSSECIIVSPPNVELFEGEEFKHTALIDSRAALDVLHSDKSTGTDSTGTDFGPRFKNGIQHNSIVCYTEWKSDKKAIYLCPMPNTDLSLVKECDTGDIREVKTTDLNVSK